MVKRTSRKYSRKISKKYSRKTYKKKYSRKNYKKKNKRTKKRKSNKKKNIMKGGNFKTRLTSIPEFDEKPEWYGEPNLDTFLKSNMKIDGVDNDVKLGCFKEIIIAGFTDCMRNGINGIIEFLNEFAEEKSSTRGWKWYVVAAGGDGFNRLLTDADKRPISPDIDVKVTYDIFGLGDNLSKYIRYLQVSTEVSAALDAAVVYINHNITREPVPEKPPTLPEGFGYTLLDQFIILFKKWKGLCDYHNFLKPFEKLNHAEIGNFKTIFEDYFKLFNMKDYPPRLIKRLSLMESGYNGKTLVFNNITLYALDLKFLNLPSFSGFAGILDVVITIPDQMGFLTGPPQNPQNLDSDFKQEDDSRKTYSISENYYLHDMEILLLFGLRIGNHKIIKDIDRLTTWIKDKGITYFKSVADRTKITGTSNINEKLRELYKKIKSIKEDITKAGDYPSNKQKSLEDNFENLTKEITSLVGGSKKSNKKKNNHKQNMKGGGIYNDLYNEQRYQLFISGLEEIHNLPVITDNEKFESGIEVIKLIPGCDCKINYNNVEHVVNGIGTIIPSFDIINSKMTGGSIKKKLIGGRRLNKDKIHNPLLDYYDYFSFAKLFKYINVYDIYIQNDNKIYTLIPFLFHYNQSLGKIIDNEGKVSKDVIEPEDFSKGPNFYKKALYLAKGENIYAEREDAIINRPPYLMYDSKDNQYYNSKLDDGIFAIKGDFKPIFRTNTMMTEPVQQILCIYILSYLIDSFKTNPKLIPYICHYRFPHPISSGSIDQNDKFVLQYLLQSPFKQCNPINIQDLIDNLDKPDDAATAAATRKKNVVYHLKKIQYQLFGLLYNIIERAEIVAEPDSSSTISALADAIVEYKKAKEIVNLVHGVLTNVLQGLINEDIGKYTEPPKTASKQEKETILRTLQDLWNKEDNSFLEILRRATGAET